MECARDLLLRHWKAGRLADYLRSSDLDGLDRDEVVKQLAELHNIQLVDAVVAFRDLKCVTCADYSFFQAADVFVDALPELTTSIEDLLPTIANLDRESGNDAGGLRLLRTFCTLLLSRPNWLTDALGMIENAPDEYHRVLSPILVQCGNSDEDLIARAIHLSGHDSIQIRIGAVHAMSQFDWVAYPDLAASAFDAVERRSLEDTDPTIMRVTISAALKLSAAYPNQEARARSLIGKFLDESPSDCIAWTAQQMRWHGASWGDQTIAMVLRAFRLNTADDAGAVPTIDAALAALLESPRHVESLAALADLVERFGKMDEKNFVSSARAIRANPSLQRRVATRWLASPIPNLSRSVRAIATSRVRPASPIEADPAELDCENTSLLGFLARKAIGHLFDHPYDLSAFLISLIRVAAADEARSLIGTYLQEMILENYPGDVSAFVTELSIKEGQEAKETIDKALSFAQNYHKDLGSVSSVQSLRPSRADRYAYQLYFSRILQKAHEEGATLSPLLSSFPRSILLYGRASIDHVTDLSGASRRMTTNLQTVTSYVEVPIARIVDPVGLETMLAAFRVERMSP